MKTRWVSIIVLWVLVLILGVGASSVYGQKVTIELWDQMNGPGPRAAMDYIIDLFEKENPNVSIGHRRLPNVEADEIVRMAFAGGNPPDISETQDYFTSKKLLEAGKIIDLNDWFAEYGDRFPAAAQALVDHKGDYWAVPLAFFTVNHIFYNKTLAKELGFTEPRDYDEYLRICEKVKNQGVTPQVFGNKDAWPGDNLFCVYAMKTMGIERYRAMIDRKDPEEGPRWTDPDVIRAAQYLRDYGERGYFTKGAAVTDYEASKMLFFGGKGLFLQTGSWYMDFQIPPNFEWGFFEFPSPIGEIGYTRRDTNLDYLTKFQVASTTSHPELALKFLEVLSRPDVQYEAVFKIMNMLPAVMKNVPVEELTEFQSAVMELAQNATGAWGDLAVHLPPGLGFGWLFEGNKAMIEGQITPLEFVQKAEEIHKEELLRK